MFDIGFGEMVLLAAIALVAIGPKQLPEVAQVVGRFLNELRRMSGDLTRTMMDTRDQAHQVLRDTADHINKELTIDVQNQISHHQHDQQQQSLPSDSSQAPHLPHDPHQVAPATAVAATPSASTEVAADDASQMAFPLSDSNSTERKDS